MTSNAINHRISLVKLAHSFVAEQVKSGAWVVDATVGNGHDTQFLLDLVKPNGKVFGFDIQQNAIDITQQTLHGTLFLDCLTLIRASHTNMGELIPLAYHGNISAIMFNLGYLPGGDKHIITQADSTLAALSCASQLLSSDGIITILVYPGHEGGEVESNQVLSWCTALDPAQFQVRQFQSSSDKPSAPKLFVVNKRC